MFGTLALATIAAAVVIAVCMKSDALIMFGGGVTDMRGSIAGTTFSRSRSGNYARARKKPINPHSTLQNTRRAEMAYLMKFWSNNLTEQERVDWRAYALGTTWTNRLGQTIEVNGNSAFVRLNMLQRLTPSTVITAAPLAMGHAGGVTQSFSPEYDTTKLQIDEPTGSFDKDIDIMTLWYFMGIPREVGNIAIPKGFKYCGRVWGSSGTPLTFPYELTATYTMALGQRITVKTMFQDAQYRVSGPHYMTALAASS